MYVHCSVSEGKPLESKYSNEIWTVRLKNLNSYGHENGEAGFFGFLIRTWSDFLHLWFTVPCDAGDGVVCSQDAIVACVRRMQACELTTSTMINRVSRWLESPCHTVYLSTRFLPQIKGKNGAYVDMWLARSIVIFLYFFPPGFWELANDEWQVKIS